MAFDYSGLGGAVQQVMGGIGGIMSSAGYDKAAAIDEENARIVKRSVGIQAMMADRQAYQVVGATEAAVAANGLTLGGSAMDLLRSNTQQLSLDKQLTMNQGQIDENAWLEKAAANRGAADAAMMGGIGGILGGVASFAGLFSDDRLKENLVIDGEFVPGMNYYKYNFVGSDTVWRGLLAREVMEVKPDCVYKDDNGFYRVDYTKLGAEMTRG